jgi:hypothetical protein
MATTIRAAIMLGVLVGLPAAWMYYGPLPNNAQRVVDRFVAAAKEAVNWEKHFKPSAGTEAKAAAAAPALENGTPPLAAEQAPLPGTGDRSATLAEHLEPLLARLRDLGAAEYALEPWGAEQRMFRFRCEMPLGGGPQSTEQFEAIAADPRASIERVVADVSTWQAERLAMVSR